MNYNVRGIVLGIIILTICFTGCSKKETESKKAPNTKETTTFAVNITSVVKGEINDYLEMNGDVKSETEVDVYPDMTGKLVQLRVKIGDNITKNQIIADVDPSVPGMIYSLSPVKSTINGTVTDIPKKIGSTVSPQTAIVKAGVLNTIEINAYIAEKFIPKIKIGQPVVIRLDAYPDEEFMGHVSILSPVVDPQTRMMEVKIRPDRVDNRIKPGMFAKVRIVTERKNNIIKIPYECVVSRFGEDFVFVVDDALPTNISKKKFQDNLLSKITNQDEKTFIQGLYLYNDSEESYEIKSNLSDTDKSKYRVILNNIGYIKVKKTIVKLGIHIEDQQEIVSGLDANQYVVQRGQTLLEDGSFIKVITIVPPLEAKDDISIK